MTPNLSASTMQSAYEVFQTFIDQWKTGANVEVRFFCERGNLKVNLCADLGLWRPTTGELGPRVWDYGGLHKQSPSRLRRREKRAAERKQSAAAEKCAAEKAAAEKCAAEKAAVEMCAAEKAAAEKCAAEKAAAEMCAAEKAAAEKCATEKAAEKCAATASADVASTSCLGSQHQPTPWNTCWTCEGDLSPDHKCDGPAGHISAATCMSPLNPAVVRPSPSAPIVLKKPVKMVDGSPIWTPRTKSNR